MVRLNNKVIPNNRAKPHKLADSMPTTIPRHTGLGSNNSSTHRSRIKTTPRHTGLGWGISQRVCNNSSGQIGNKQSFLLGLIGNTESLCVELSTTTDQGA